MYYERRELKQSFLYIENRHRYDEKMKTETTQLLGDDGEMVQLLFSSPCCCMLDVRCQMYLCCFPVVVWLDTSSFLMRISPGAGLKKYIKYFQTIRQPAIQIQKIMESLSFTFFLLLYCNIQVSILHAYIHTYIRVSIIHRHIEIQRENTLMQTQMYA